MVFFVCFVFLPCWELGHRRGGGASKEREDSLHSKVDGIKSSRKSQTYKGSEKLHPRLESCAGKSHREGSVI